MKYPCGWWCPPPCKIEHSLRMIINAVVVIIIIIMMFILIVILNVINLCYHCHTHFITCCLIVFSRPFILFSFCFHFVSFHLDLYLPPRSRSRNLGCQIDGERNSVHDSVRRPMVLFEFVFFGSSPRFSQLALLYLPVLRIQVPQQILSFAGISWWCYIEFEQTTKICLPCLPCEKFNSHIFSPFFPWNGYNPIPLLLNTPIASQKNVEIPIHHGFVARGCYFLNGGGGIHWEAFSRHKIPASPKIAPGILPCQLQEGVHRGCKDALVDEKPLGQWWFNQQKADFNIF